MVSASYAQNYMDKILEKTCDCVNKVSDSLEIDKYNLELGVCMIEASMPYKKQLRKDFDINMDKIDMEGEKLGRLIGVKMASFCPNSLLKLTKRSAKTESKVVMEDTISGMVLKVEADFFVIISLKDNIGKTTKFYWLSFVESNIEMPSFYSSLAGKSVEISYKKEEYFDPKIEQYRSFNIITKLKLVDN